MIRNNRASQNLHKLLTTIDEDSQQSTSEKSESQSLLVVAPIRRRQRMNSINAMSLKIDLHVINGDSSEDSSSSDEDLDSIVTSDVFVNFQNEIYKQELQEQRKKSKASLSRKFESDIYAPWLYQQRCQDNYSLKLDYWLRRPDINSERLKRVVNHQSYMSAISSVDSIVELVDDGPIVSGDGPLSELMELLDNELALLRPSVAISADSQNLHNEELVERVDNSSSESLRPATRSMDPEIDLTGSIERVTWRRELNCQQIIESSTSFFKEIDLKSEEDYWNDLKLAYKQQQDENVSDCLKYFCFWSVKKSPPLEEMYSLEECIIKVKTEPHSSLLRKAFIDLGWFNFSGTISDNAPLCVKKIYMDSFEVNSPL